MPLPTLSADKANHFVYGALAYVVGAWAGRLFGLPSRQAGLASAVLAAVAKEIYDQLRNRRVIRRGERAPHEVSAWDSLATAAGGVMCWAGATAAAGES